MSRREWALAEAYNMLIESQDRYDFNEIRCHSPLEALDLKGKKRFVADLVASSSGGGKLIFIEIDKSGAASHSVLKYFPYLKALFRDQALVKKVFLLHAFGEGFCLNKNQNLISHRKLAAFMARIMEEYFHPRFKYVPSDPPIRTKEAVPSWLRLRLDELHI